ncbi:cytidine deaminase [Kribbella orskensis]|uniref:Cytidine deaminase n=1 Tax=Kribbella orskensis TaxID=2512216 RepID=A0ABY2BBD2_9ACTN|nr:MULTISPECIES: cytidine deaminase [Kribbella]TCM43470.1 cytidine deaminase [Kribbella sp. VKM Ac-2568]TCN34260.1 cytidine deaminase [Kribbella sp. VKM Ac-2500]TCO14434.1 cytidine deaminase [Kribbella orskensis]
MSADLPAEDAKLVTLARAARARTRAAEGASVRDTDGRTYAACTVQLDTVRLSALQLAVAMAVSSGVKGIEAAAVVTEADEVDVEVVRYFGGAALPVVVANGNGEVRDVVHT